MPEADFEINQGDTLPIFAQQLLDQTGTPIPLPGAAVKLTLRDLTAPNPLTLTGAQTIADPVNSIVQWAPSVTDTTTPGLFMGKWIVTFANGAVQTFPTDGYLVVKIVANLAATTSAQLVSLPEVKDHLNMPATRRVSDDRLLRWIQAITVLIEHEVGPVIVQRFDEKYDGGQTFIRLRRRPSTAIGTTPVITLIACSEYNGPIEWPLAIIRSPDQGTMYSCMLDDRLGIVERRTAGGGVQAFPHMPQSVHVIYEAGQQIVPANVREAAMETVRVYYETTMNVGRGSRTRADDSDTGPQIGYVLPPSARRLLSPNKRHPAVA